MNLCADRDYKAADKTLNETYHALVAATQQGRAGQAAEGAAGLDRLSRRAMRLRHGGHRHGQHPSDGSAHVPDGPDPGAGHSISANSFIVRKATRPAAASDRVQRIAFAPRRPRRCARPDPGLAARRGIPAARRVLRQDGPTGSGGSWAPWPARRRRWHTRTAWNGCSSSGSRCGTSAPPRSEPAAWTAPSCGPSVVPNDFAGFFTAHPQIRLGLLQRTPGGEAIPGPGAENAAPRSRCDPPRGAAVRPARPMLRCGLRRSSRSGGRCSTASWGLARRRRDKQGEGLCPSIPSKAKPLKSNYFQAVSRILEPNREAFDGG